MDSGRAPLPVTDPNTLRGSGTRRINPPKVVAICVLVLALFGSLTSATLIAIGWMALAVFSALGALRFRGQDRVVLSLTVIIAVCVATPVTRLPGVTTLLLVAFAVVIGSSVLIGVLSRPAWRPSRGVGSLVLMLSTVALTTVAASSLDSLVRFAAIVVLPVLGCFTLAHRLDGSGRRSITLAIIALGLCEGGLAIVEAFVMHRHLGPPAQLDDSGVEKLLANELLPFVGQRAQGTLGHPLALAFLLAVCLALVLRDQKFHAAFRWLAVVTLAIGIIATGSRSAIIFSVLLVAFVPLRKATLGRVLAAGLSAGLVVLVLVSRGFAFNRIFADFAGTGSYTHRVGAVDAAYRLWATQDVVATFLGNGYGSTARLFEAGVLQSDGFNAVDNQLVLLLAQGGLVALASFLSVCCMAVIFGSWLVRAAVLVVVANSFVFDWMNWPSAAAVGFTAIGAALVALPATSRTRFPPDHEVNGQGTVSGRLAAAGPAGDASMSSADHRARTSAAPLSPVWGSRPPISPRTVDTWSRDQLQNRSGLGESVGRQTGACPASGAF